MFRLIGRLIRWSAGYKRYALPVSANAMIHVYAKDINRALQIRSDYMNQTGRRSA